MENELVSTSSTTEQVDKVGNNTEGVGGFGDNPQNINKGGRPKNEQRFGYWLQFFKNLTIVEFVNYSKEKTQEKMYVAEAIAYDRVANSRKELAEYKDLADRTEGRAPQKVEVDGKLDMTVGIEKLGKVIDDIISEQ